MLFALWEQVAHLVQPAVEIGRIVKKLVLRLFLICLQVDGILSEPFQFLIDDILVVRVLILNGELVDGKVGAQLLMLLLGGQHRLRLLLRGDVALDRREVVLIGGPEISHTAKARLPVLS